MALKDLMNRLGSELVSTEEAAPRLLDVIRKISCLALEIKAIGLVRMLCWRYLGKFRILPGNFEELLKLV